MKTLSALKSATTVSLAQSDEYARLVLICSLLLWGSNPLAHAVFTSRYHHPEQAEGKERRQFRVELRH